MSALNNLLYLAVLYRVATKTNSKKEIIQKKSTKTLMESNPPKKIKKAYIDSVTLSLKQLVPLRIRKFKYVLQSLMNMYENK